MNVDDVFMSQSDTSSIDSMIRQRSDSPDSQILGECSRASSQSVVSVISILYSIFSFVLVFIMFF